MTKATVAITVLILVVFASCAGAQSSAGLFFQEGYEAEWLSFPIEKVSLYLEKDICGLGYELAIVQYPVSDSFNAVIRVEDNWRRLGVQFPVGGGLSRFTVRPLLGITGDSSNWLDVYCPSLPISNSLSLSGMVRIRGESDNSYWAGPAVSFGRVSAFCWHDMNGGPWSACLSVRLD